MNRILSIFALATLPILPCSLVADAARVDTGALRLHTAESVAPGGVCLIGVERQDASDGSWHYADPGTLRATVAGPGRLAIDPSLLTMNPLTLEILPGATGEVKVTVTAANGLTVTQSVRIAAPAMEEFAAVIEPDAVTHRFSGLGGGVLFYDNQFDIADGPELYDWCFADVRTSFLHLLIRPDCEPSNDNDDWRKQDWAKFDFRSAARPLRIAREALRRNPGLKIYVSVYTPPAWLKSNNRTSGEGTLKDDPSSRKELAEFIFAWLRHAQDEGVTVDYVSFFNEPDWSHSQDGMRFQDFGTMADAFAETAAALDELCAADRALKVKPRLVFADTLGAGSITRSGANTEKLKTRADKLARVDVWGAHDYWNTSGDYWDNRFRELRAFPSVDNKPVWMTEWAQRYRHGDLDSALEYGRNMLNALRVGAEAWMVFEWVHPYGNQSGLISTDWGEQTGQHRYWRSKAYHVFRQIANTTPPGAQVVRMTRASGAPLEYLALRYDRRMVVHLMNSGSSPVSAKLSIPKGVASPVACWQTSPSKNVEQLPVNGPGSFSWMPAIRAKGPVGDAVGTIVLPPYSLTTLRW